MTEATELEGSGEHAKPASRSGLLVLLLLLLIAAVVAIWVFFFRVTYGDVWAETTVPYDATCEEGCVQVTESHPGHAHGAAAITFYMNPDVDDAIAQWGDCMKSIFACVELESDPTQPDRQKAETVSKCVAASVCPKACIDRFSNRVGGNPGANPTRVETVFANIFVNETGWCVPREANP